jgi:SAM-dependent methyltransferase
MSITTVDQDRTVGQGGRMTADGYDRVAPGYAARFLGELADKPLDRLLLDLFAGRVGGLGVIADLGCGPGQVARYLHDHGAPALGMDLSPRMVEIAAERHPGIGFQAADMRSLPAPDGLEEAGFSVDVYVERKPYESTTRAYVLAHRP